MDDKEPPNHYDMSEFEDEEIDIYDQIQITNRGVNKPLRKVEIKKRNRTLIRKLPLTHNKIPLHIKDNEEEFDDVNESVTREILLHERVEAMNEKLVQWKQSITVGDVYQPTINTSAVDLAVIDLINENYDHLSHSIKLLLNKLGTVSDNGLILHLFRLYMYSVKYLQEEYFDPQLKDQFAKLLTQLIVINQNIDKEFSTKFVHKSGSGKRTSPTIDNGLTRQVTTIKIPSIVYKRLNLPEV